LDTLKSKGKTMGTNAITEIATVTDLAAICAELLRQGIVFDTSRDRHSGMWTVHLVGY